MAFAPMEVTRNWDTGVLPADPSAHADEDLWIWAIFDRDCNNSRPQSPTLVAFDLLAAGTRYVHKMYFNASSNKSTPPGKPFLFDETPNATEIA